MGSHIDIQVVSNPRSHADFIDMPWRVNQNDADWAPPLRMAVKKLLDTKKYPFFNHGEAAFFMAYKHGEPAGRIAAIDNKLHAKTYNDGVGFFGFAGKEALETDVGRGRVANLGTDSCRGRGDDSTCACRTQCSCR